MAPVAQPGRDRRAGARPAPPAPGRCGQRRPAGRPGSGRYSKPGHARRRAQRRDRRPDPPQACRRAPAADRRGQPGRDRHRTRPVSQHRSPVRSRRRPWRAACPRLGTPQPGHPARLRALPSGTMELRHHQRHRAVAGDPRPRLPERLLHRPRPPRALPRRRHHPRSHSTTAQAPRGHRLDHDQTRQSRSRRPDQPGLHPGQIPRTHRPQRAHPRVRPADDQPPRPATSSNR